MPPSLFDPRQRDGEHGDAAGVRAGREGGVLLPLEHFDGRKSGKAASIDRFPSASVRLSMFKAFSFSFFFFCDNGDGSDCVYSIPPHFCVSLSFSFITRVYFSLILLLLSASY